MAVSSSASLASKPPLPALCRTWYLHLQVYLPVAKSPIAFKPPLYSYLSCVVFHWSRSGRVGTFEKHPVGTSCQSPEGIVRVKNSIWEFDTAS